MLRPVVSERPCPDREVRAPSQAATGCPETYEPAFQQRWENRQSAALLISARESVEWQPPGRNRPQPVRMGD